MLAIKNTSSNKNDFFKKDIWLAKDISLEPNTVHSNYYLSFKKIRVPWLKDTLKRFIQYQSTTRAFSTCKKYIDSITHLDHFIRSLDIPISKNKVNRGTIIGFVQYLSNLGLSPGSRRVILINLRTFHEIIIQENWLKWPLKPIIYSPDLPVLPESPPKYIDESVLRQLKAHIYSLSFVMQNAVIILIETGRRISEVCTLPYDCLEPDDNNEFFLRVNEKKLKRTRLIPISNKCVMAIKAQQELVDNRYGKHKFLFPSQGASKSPIISARAINIALNKLSIAKNILDINGKVWRFHSHQFRHTLGTKMINNGVPQVIVQQYLGHESPEMTSKYAHIHNKTMRKEFSKYQSSLIDIKGNASTVSDKINAKWLKRNIISQTLPNGLCALPLTQNKCPHANACLTCAHFRTSKDHLCKHKSQLNETKKIINHASKNGWTRIVEMNSDVANNLTRIIETIENQQND